MPRRSSRSATPAAPTPYFLALLTLSNTYPVHRASVEEHGQHFARPGTLVSNGAYRLEEWVVQSHIRLVRNPHYREVPAIDEVLYFPIENQSVELKRYRAGELDMTSSVPSPRLGWIRENLADELVIAPHLGTWYLGFNVSAPTLADKPGLRRALSMAIDRELITGRVTGAGEVPAWSWVPGGVAGYAPQVPGWASWPRHRQLAEARRLYAEAGYSPQQPLEISILYNTGENNRRIGLAVATMWKEQLGVETTLENQEWKVFLETRRQRATTQVFRASWIADYNDPFSFAELMHSAHGLNHSGYASARYDELIERAGREPDPRRRRGLLEEAERILLEDQPIVPIYFYVTRRLVKPRVGGYQPNVLDHHYSKDWYLTESGRR